MALREKYIKEKGYSYFNNMVLNEYALWLEKKITELDQALQLQQTGVSGSSSDKELRDAYQEGLSDGYEQASRENCH